MIRLQLLLLVVALVLVLMLLLSVKLLLKVGRERRRQRDRRSLGVEKGRVVLAIAIALTTELLGQFAGGTRAVRRGISVDGRSSRGRRLRDNGGGRLPLVRCEEQNGRRRNRRVIAG